MFLRPRMTRTGGHAGPYVWGGVTGVTNSDNPWLTAVQENTATRLVASGSSYDAEQRFLVNENPLSVRTALGVGLGSAGCAGPIFAPDKYGPAMWIDQTTAFGGVVAPMPALTTANTWSVITKHTPSRLTGNRRLWISGASGIPRAYYDSAGKINYYENTTGEIKSASTVASLLGVSDIGAQPIWVAYVAAGTSLSILVSLDGSSWTAAVSGATVTASDLGGANLYVGSNAAGGSYSVGKFYRLTVHDGDETAEKAAEFLPSMFVGGNRANGDTAVDAYGVTWTIERPAATTDMPRVMVGNTEQYISLPGVAGEYVSTPDTVANSITGDIDLRIRLEMPDLTPSPTRALISKWVGSGNQRAVRFEWRSDQYLRLYWSTNGADFPSESSSVVVPATVGEPIWVRATLDVSTGDVNFYTSTTDTNDDTLAVWTQLGATQTGSATSIFDSTAPWEIGSNDLGAGQQLEANVYVAAIYDGIDGTLVERIDAAEASPNSTTWTSSTSGATVTVNKSASSQYHATVVPAGTTIVQGDGVNDFAQVCGDDTVGNVAAAGVTLVLDYKVDSGAGAWAAFASSGDAGGLTIRRWSTLPRTYGYPNDGTNQPLLGEAADNITYGQRAMFALAVANGDQEGYVDGASVDTATSALTDARALGSLTFGSFPDRTAPAAFDLYGAAVLGERTSDTEAAAYATEGLTR